MSKHTPGPWSIDWNISRLDIWSDARSLVTSLLRPGDETLNARACANARLIAAAPDLLEALNSAEYSVNVVRACLMDSVETHGTHGGWLHSEALRLDSELDLMRAAIAKATGQQEEA